MLERLFLYAFVGMSLPRIVRGRWAGAIFAMAARENRDGPVRDLSSGILLFMRNCRELFYTAGGRQPTI